MQRFDHIKSKLFKLRKVTEKVIVAPYPPGEKNIIYHFLLRDVDSPFLAKGNYVSVLTKRVVDGMTDKQLSLYLENQFLQTKAYYIGKNIQGY